MAGRSEEGRNLRRTPQSCTVTFERRTVPGETNQVVEAQLRLILDKLVARVPDFKYELRVGFSRSPFQRSKEDTFIATALNSIGAILERAFHPF